jgi:pimeloyl-ACP methyl ester carboxylesterase
MRLVALTLFCASIASAAPCVNANESCTEWISLGSNGARSLVYRSYSLEGRNPAITRALIMVHGAGRDADNYFRNALAAAFLGGALENTVVVAPRMASSAANCHDKLAAHEISWNCLSWRSGGAAISDADVTSFDFLDEVLRKVARKDIFPNLKQIVVSGHSAGGQVVNRYEMSNRVHDKLGVPITYVVSNPSSYAWPDSVRPTDAAYSVQAHAPGYIPVIPAGATAFRDFTGVKDCTTYDKWPYGLKDRTGYSEKETDEQLKTQLISRPTTYLLGELDVLPLGGFDGSCSGMAQGPTRLARGEGFGKFVNEKLGAHHSVKIVPECGHNARCMFTAEEALPLLFPK